MSPITGWMLAFVAGCFALKQWESPPPSEVTAGVLVGALACSGLLYLAGLLALAFAAGVGRLGMVAALESQLLKYVPGTLWQARATIAVSGVRGAAILGLATVSAAAVGLAAVGTWATTGIAALVLLVAGFAVSKVSGSRMVCKVFGGSLVAAALIAGSGGAIGAIYGGGFLNWARSTGAAWGVGVLALPVPAGLGVREAALALLEPGAAASAVAALHRAVTVAVDAAVGLVAMVIVRRSVTVPDQNQAT